MFAIPWAINSWLESCLSSIIPSATTAESSDSIAASTAIVTAGIIKFFMLAKSTEIHWNSGSERGISPKREKIVSTLHPNCETPRIVGCL